MAAQVIRMAIRKAGQKAPNPLRSRSAGKEKRRQVIDANVHCCPPKVEFCMEVRCCSSRSNNVAPALAAASLAASWEVVKLQGVDVKSAASGAALI